MTNFVEKMFEQGIVHNWGHAIFDISRPKPSRRHINFLFKALVLSSQNHLFWDRDGIYRWTQIYNLL